MAIRTGTRCTTFTQLPEAFCGGRIANSAPVAGLTPYERPAGAPLIKTLARTPEQTARLTAGVAQPLPLGIEWLKDQGAWYNPFTRPGMVG